MVDSIILETRSFAKLVNVAAVYEKFGVRNLYCVQFASAWGTFIFYK